MKEIVPTKPYPPLGEAAAVLLAILTHIKLNNLFEFQLAVTAWNKEVLTALGQLELTDRQVRLLTKYNDHLHLVDRRKKATLMVCPECRSWLPQVGAAKTAPRCPMVAGCPGKMVRAVAAKRVEITGDE